MTPPEPAPPRAEFSHLLDDGGGQATTAGLAPIVARARRRRERRLKVITGVSIAAALAGASVAGITRATNVTTSSAKASTAPRVSKNGRAPNSSTTWATRHRALGTAPKGLRWSMSPATKSGQSSSAATIAPTSPGPNLCTVGGCITPYPGYQSGPISKLFVRTAGDVTVRAFHQTTPTVVPQPYASNGSAAPSSPTSSAVPGAPASATGPSAGIAPIYDSCESSQSLVVEVSNPGAVGSVAVPLPSIAISGPGQPFEVIDSSAVGVAEASPIEVLTVHVTADVSSVRVSFGDGTSDQMTVVSGWAVLVGDGSGPLPATVVALDGSGNAIARASINDVNAIAQPAGCLVPAQAQPQVGSGTARPATPSK
jgi:hypothetical protein